MTLPNHAAHRGQALRGCSGDTWLPYTGLAGGAKVSPGLWRTGDSLSVVSAGCMEQCRGHEGAASLRDGGAASRKAARLHTFCSASPGEQGLLRKRSSRKEDGNRGMGRTKQELNSLRLSKKTLEGKAPGAPHSHPMAEVPKTRAAAETLGQRRAVTKRSREVSGVDRLALFSGQSGQAPMSREGTAGAAVSPREPPGWPQSHSVPLAYPPAFPTE